jgi:hypothetical protein
MGLVFFRLKLVKGSWNKCLQQRESGKIVLYPQLVIKGKKLHRMGLVPLYEVLDHSGSSVKEGVEQPAIVPSEL